MPDRPQQRRAPRMPRASAALTRLAGMRVSAMVLALAVAALTVISVPASASAATATHVVPRAKATSPTCKTVRTGKSTAAAIDAQLRIKQMYNV